MFDDQISTLLTEVLDCVVAAFEDADAPGFCRSGLVGGTVAWDDCCDCGNGNGQLWVRLVEWLPDPDIEQRDHGCNESSRLSIGIGTLRCVPTIDEEGNAPSAAAETAAAERLHSDAQIVRDGVACCLESRQWVGWVPLGYEGGCGGGEHIFTVPFHPCQCAPIGSV